MYGSQLWEMKKQHVDEVRVAKMRMLKQMNVKTRKYMTKNEDIRDDIEEYQLKIN